MIDKFRNQSQDSQEPITNIQDIAHPEYSSGTSIPNDGSISPSQEGDQHSLQDQNEPNPLVTGDQRINQAMEGISNRSIDSTLRIVMNPDFTPEKIYFPRISEALKDPLPSIKRKDGSGIKKEGKNTTFRFNLDTASAPNDV